MANFIQESVRSPIHNLLIIFSHVYSISYKLKERRRHGEAGSVDPRKVAAERTRMRRLLSRYEKKDQFNVDESSFFPAAPPDRSLCSVPMPGKKQDKFRITASFACNADGTEKLPILFIGKAVQPRCFNKKDPARMKPAILYRANKKAWMTSLIFEE